MGFSQPKNDSEAIMLLWDRLFGNGIEGAIPRIEKSLSYLQNALDENRKNIETEKLRFTDYVSSREATCPLLERKSKRGAETVRVMAIVFGMNTAVVGIATLIFRLLGII